MNTTQAIEITVMYDEVKDYKSPLAVLRRLSKIKGHESITGAYDVQTVRMWTYGLWLKQNKKDWYEYYEGLLKFIKAKNVKKVEELKKKTPKGWIAPMKYIMKED